MHVLVVHQSLSASADRADEQDVLVQAAYVRQGLQTLGNTVETLPVDFGLATLKARLKAGRPDCIFNLVESLAGSDARIVDVPLLLDELHIPYTGAPAQALLATNHKVRAKQSLRDAGLPTPDWTTFEGPDLAPPYIVKAIEEHASLGMTAASVVLQPNRSARAMIGEPSRFAEAYIDGREFNVSLLAGPTGPRVLPLAEIDFSAFSASQVRIVDYAAKWDETSFAYHHTPRRFLSSWEEPALSARLRNLAEACWRLFNLRGYARVDFRVDHAGEPWILEVNCNPCLSPDAGFAAALLQAEIDWPQALTRILSDALRGVRVAP